MNEQVIQYLRKKFSTIPFQLYCITLNDFEIQRLYTTNDRPVEINKLIGQNNENHYSSKSDGNWTSFSFYYDESICLLFVLFEPDVFLSDDDQEILYTLFSTFLLEQKNKEKEAELISFQQCIRSLTSSSPCEDVLSQVMKQALTVIHAADTGFIQIYDDEKKELIIKTSIGYDEKQLNTRLASNKEFENGTPISYTSEIEAATNSLQIKATLSVPIYIDFEMVGVITVQQFHQNSTFTEHDLHLLQQFSGYAGLAIQKKKVCKELHQSWNEKRKITKMVEEKRKLLAEQESNHQNLIQLLLENKNVPDIITQLQHLLRRKVYFFNNIDVTIDYGNYLPLLPDFEEDFFTILQNKKEAFTTKLPDEINEMSDLLIYPIVTDNLLFGALMIPGENNLPLNHQNVLEEASMLILLQLLKRKNAQKERNQQLYNEFQNILQGKESHLLVEKDDLFSIAILHIESKEHNTVGERVIVRLKRLLHEECIFINEEKIILLLQGNSFEKIKQQITSLKLQLPKYEKLENSKIFVGISSILEGSFSISECYEEANKIVKYVRNSNGNRLVEYDELGINRLFLSQSTITIDEFVNAFLLPLYTDKAKKNELEKTLFTFVDNNQSLKQTALRLSIQIETVNERLKMIEELLHIQLSSSYDYLQVSLACHLANRKVQK